MNITQIKQSYTCIDFLERQGVKLQRGASGYTCRCPWREDKHPSMSITLSGIGWIDHASGEKGDLIDLVKKCINSEDTGKVIAHIEQAMAAPHTFSFHAESSCGVEGEGFKSFEVGQIRSRKLMEYLWGRGVSERAATAAGLKQAYYRLPSSEEEKPPLFALAFRNDSGGYELRSAYFKGSKSPKDISSHLAKENAPVVIFEGFFDLLSFIELESLEKKPKLNWLVLNSVANVDKAIEKLATFENKIYLLLDNDQAGTMATEKLLKALPIAVDIRNRITPSNDVNDYLIDYLKKLNKIF